MDLKINSKGKNITLKNPTKCNTIFSRFRGLMFRRKLKPLIFEFSKPVTLSIHSLFVFKSFRAIWLLNNEIVDDKIIKPFRFHIKPKKEFNVLIELPLKE